MSFNLSDPAIIAAVKQLKAYMDSTNPTEAARIYAEKKAQFGFTDADFNSAVSGSVTAPINTTTAAPPTPSANPAFDYQALGLTPSYSTTGGVETGDLQQTLEGYSKDNGNGTFTQYDTSGKLVSSSSPYSSIGQLAGSGAATLAKTIAPIAGAALIGGGLAGAGPLGGMLGGAGTAGVDYGLTSGLGAASGGTAAGTGAGGGLIAGSGGLGLTTGGGLGLTAGGLTAGAAAAGTGGSLGTGLTAGGSGLGLTAGGSGLGLTTGGAGTGLLTSGAVGTGAVDYGLTSGLGSIGSGLTSGLGNLGTGLTSGFSGLNTGLTSGLGGLNTGLTSGLGNLGTGLTSGLGNIGSGLTSGLGAVDYSLTSGLGGLNTGLTSGLSGLSSGLTSSMGNLGSGLTSGLGNIGSGLTSGLGAVDYSLTSGLGGLNTGLTSGLGSLGSGLTSGLGSLGSGLTGSLGNIGTGLTSGLGGLGNTLTSGLSSLNTGLGSLGTNLLTGLSQIAGSQISANDARNLQNDQIAANKATLEANQAYADKQTKAAQDYAAKINQENINRALTVQSVSNDSINALTPLQQAAYAAQAKATQTGLLSDAQLANTAARYATEAGNKYASGLTNAAQNTSTASNTIADQYRTGLNNTASNYANAVNTAGQNQYNSLVNNAGNYATGLNTIGDKLAQGLNTSANQYATGINNASNNYATGLNNVANNYAGLTGTLGDKYAGGLNTAADKYASNIGSAGNTYAGLLTGAGQKYSDTVNTASKSAADLMKFKPVGVSTRFGSSNATYDANGNLTNAGYTLSPEAKSQQDALMGASNGYLGQFQDAKAATAGMGQGANSMFNLGNQYLASTPQAQAQKWMTDQQALLAAGRESTLSSIQNKLAQQGRLGVSVGGAAGQSATNPEMAAYMNSIQQQDLGLAANATQAGQQYAQFGANLVNQGGTTLQNMYGTQNAAYQPYATALGGANTLEGYGRDALNQGLAIGQTNTAANTNAANMGYQGAQNAAGTMYGANSAAAAVPYNTTLAGQQSVLNNANTGLGTQYQGGMGALNNMYNSANTGLQNQYQGSLAGQGAVFNNANTGMNTQYQGAATGLGSVYNNANTGIGSVYQGNLSGQNNIYGSANTGLGTVYNTGITGQNNMLTAANSGLNAQYQNAMNPAQYQEYLNYQRQGIGDQYLAQLQSGNAQAAYNTGSILQQQQAGYANKFAGTAANTLTGTSVNAPFAQNTVLQQTAPNYGGLVGSIGNNLATGNNTGVAGLLSSGLNKVSNWWGS